MKEERVFLAYLTLSVHDQIPPHKHCLGSAITRGF